MTLYIVQQDKRVMGYPRLFHLGIYSDKKTAKKEPSNFCRQLNVEQTVGVWVVENPEYEAYGIETNQDGH